jgi:hypothetical protein
MTTGPVVVVGGTVWVVLKLVPFLVIVDPPVALVVLVVVEFTWAEVVTLAEWLALDDETVTVEVEVELELAVTESLAAETNPAAARMRMVLNFMFIDSCSWASVSVFFFFLSFLIVSGEERVFLIKSWNLSLKMEGRKCR